MQHRLAQGPAKELARVIDAVILNTQDAADLVSHLSVPALAIVGESDYVGIPPGIATITVPGSHVTPREAPSETLAAVQRVVKLAVVQLAEETA